jgi:cobalt-zinc-cadmium efflux system membrane fusion protein
MNTSRFILQCALIASLVSCNKNSATALRQEDVKTQEKNNGEIVMPLSEQAEAGIQTETVQLSDLPESLQAPGEIILSDNGTWRVGVLTSGRVERVYANLGDLVQEGQTLARMHSHDVHEARADYQTSRSDLSRAEAAVALAQQNYDRALRLYSLKAGSLGEVERSRQELVIAQTAVRNEQIALERDRIHLEGNLGVLADPGADVGDEEADLVPIRAAGSGYILAKNVTPGTVVDPTKDLFVIGDLRRLWMMASVGEANIAKVRVGQLATVTASAYPSEQFYGRVTNLSPQLDPVTRVLRVRIELTNPSIKLRPAMLASAQIQIGGMRSLLLVSPDAVQQITDADVVFVRKADDRFEVRPIRRGDIFGDDVAILDGLKPEEVIVTRGSFILKSQLLKSSLHSE